MRALAARVVPVLLLALFPVLLLAGPALAAPGDPVPAPIEKGTMDPGCGLLDLSCKAGQVASNIAGDALDNLADAINEAVGNAVKSLGTVWVHIGTPDLSGGSSADWLRSQLAFYTGLMAVISVIVGAASMAITRRAKPGRDLAQSLVTLVVVNTTIVAVIGALVAGGDAFSTYIIDQSTAGTDFGSNITTMLRLSSATGMGSILMILFGIAALLSSLAQIVLMVARGGLLVIVTGLLPLSSSFTNMAVGKHWHQKMLGWTIAAILYKPAAAIIYAVAFRLTGSNVFGDDGITGILTGLLMMVMALLALPALMALAFPAVSAVSDRSSGHGGAAVAGAVATGAQVIQLHSGSGTNGGQGSGGSGSGSPGSPAGSPVTATSGAGSPGPAGAASTGTSGAAGSAGAAGAKGAGTAGSAGAAGAAGAAGVVGGVAAVGQAAVSKVQSTATDAATGPTGGQPA